MNDPKKSVESDIQIGVTEFLQGVFGPATEDETVLVGKLGAGGKGFRQMRPDEPGFRAVASGRGRGAWYFCCSSVSGRRRTWDKATIGEPGALADEDSYLMRSLEDARAVYCVVLDDVGTKVSAADVDLPAPSWIMETSPGNAQWGYILDPASEDFVLFDGFMALLAAEGCTDGGSRDRVHMFRLPGSVNQKEGLDGFRSRVTTWSPSVTWSLPALVYLFGFTEEECRAEGASGRSRVQPSAAVRGTAVPGGVGDEVLDWLSAGGYVLADDGGDWVDVTCPWAAEHTDPAANAAGYSPLGRGDDRYAPLRSFHCMHDHCSGRKAKDFLGWVTSSGGPWAAVHDPLPWLQERYVFIEQGSRIVDLGRRGRGSRDWIMKLTEFAQLHAGRMLTPTRTQPVLIATAFCEHRDTRKAANVIYRPGCGELFQEAGTWFVNQYVPPVHAETSEPPAAFLGHMAYLLPDEAERALFLDWLAFKAQNPGRRSYGVIMVAEGYGTGRSWVADLLGATLSGVQTIALGDLTGTSRAAAYNSWQKNSQLVVVEEARDTQSTVHDYYNAYETLKTVVDVRVTEGRVNDKYGAMSVERQYYNVLVFSNHVDALAIPENDRRLAVLSNPALMLDGSYYGGLWEALESGEAGRLWHWLLARDVTGFNPIYPPMTAAKVDMSELSLPASDRLAARVLAELPGELTTWRQFLHLVRSAASEDDDDMPDDQKMLRRIFTRSTKATKLRGRVEAGGKVERFRAVRNFGKWRTAEGATFQEEATDEARKNGEVIFSGASLKLVPS